MNSFLLFNSKIHTSSKTNHPAAAMMIAGDTILAIGSDEELSSIAPAGTVKMNMEGRTIWPGLTDSHLHLQNYSAFLNQVDCDTPTLEQCLAKVREKVGSTPPGEWILGHGWNQNLWESGFGRAQDLDAISTRHPIYLTDKSLHSGWANSPALSQAGITPDVADPDGGKIQRDDSGNPTGILFENAVRLVETVIPKVTRAQLKEALLAAQTSLLHFGITSVHDFDGPDCFAALQELEQEGKLILRVCKGIPVDALDHAIAMRAHTGFGSNHLWLGAVKCFADGALGPQTAAMLLPYEGSTSNYGTLQLKADDVFELGMRAVPNGLSLAIHAIGDRATHEVLNGFGMLREYERRMGLPPLNHRIEHLQLMHSDDLLKVHQLDLTASMQPQHATSDRFIAEQHWGSRSRYAYLFKTMVTSGARLIFGSDAPVETPNPFLGLHAAVTRSRAGDGAASPGWYPDEKISIDQALDAYSITPAVVAGRSKQFGSLQAGKKADMIVLDQDPFNIPPSELYALSPSAVMVDGNWVVNHL